MAKRKSVAAQNKKKKTKKQSALEVETQGEYWVEKILDWGLHDNGTVMYLVKWEDYPDEENSWELEQHVASCDDHIAFFRTRTINGRYPPKFSFKEFYKFCDCIGNLVALEDPKNNDLALIFRLVKGRVNNIDVTNQKAVKDVTDSLKGYWHRLQEARKKITVETNGKRLELVPLMKELSKALHIDKNFGSFTNFFDFVNSRPNISKKLKKIENDFNEIIKKEKEGTPITISNYIDSEVPQLEVYITDYILDATLSKKIRMIDDEDPLVSCECDDCYESRDECCTALNGFPMVYQKNNKLSPKQSEGNIIFECNSKCKCDKDCPNRQVQRGRQFKLEVFRTDSKGWGVRTLEKIPKGSYITHYPGEVISLIEAANRPTTYLFDLGAHLDSTDVEYTYVVDASKYGNVARFVNHSCAPNCRTLFTWIDRSANNLLPIIALFAIKDIRPFEELTYDYSMEVIDYYDGAEECSDFGSDFCSLDDDKERPVSPLSESSDNCANEKAVESTSIINRNVENRTQHIAFKRIKCECGADNCKQFIYS